MFPEKRLRSVGIREGIRVLTIYDDPEKRGLIKRALQLEGMKDKQLLFAEDTATAFELLSKLPEIPQLIFLNLRLREALAYPFINDFNEKRRTDSRFINSRLVVISATDDQDIVQTCRNLGADDFIPDPFEINQLVDTAERFLVRKEKKVA